jgi:rhamnogalacturonyl hydrolase YesR
MKTAALRALACTLAVALAASALAQSNPPLTPEAAKRTAPAYPVPYPPASVAEITAVLERVHGYIDRVTPAAFVDAQTGSNVADPANHSGPVKPHPTDFSLTSYEWGVTYAGLLHTAAVTGDTRYTDYVQSRLAYILQGAALFRAEAAKADDNAVLRVPFRQLNRPFNLDDSGALAAGMIKAARAGILAAELRPQIDLYLDWISNKQYRFADGTLARHRPLPDALWLDDLYMSVPALAQMAKLTGDARYFDDAARQIEQFAARMFVAEKGLYMHGWIQGMEPHPVFHWARANGWAVVAAAELLSEMPENHPRHAAVLKIYRDHIRGLAALQGRTGLWHQLLDRNDSYLETSASAMYVYAIARGVNRGWLDPLAYAGLLSTGWNAIAQQVNAQGQVENVCIGTGMGFEPSFYYYRPVSVYAAHGYGPVLLAGAEMIEFRRAQGREVQVNGGAIQLRSSPSRH